MNHKIRAGETLTVLAERYGTTVDQLTRANGIRNANQIFAGQQIKIPTAEERSADRRERFNPRQNVRERFGMGNGAGASSSSGSNATNTAPSPSPRAAERMDAAEAATEGRQSGGRDIRLKVPYYSQLIPGNGFKAGKKACFLAASAMARAAGARVQGPADRIQVATSEARDGSISISARNARTGRDYIDQQLERGRPVVVGVSHKDAAYNVDKITDHFVVITGRGTDRDGRTFYTFHDPASMSASRGSDSNVSNRFFVDDDGMLYKSGNKARGLVVNRHFEVSMVRRNA